MATGRCLLVKDGKVYGVRVDFNGTTMTDMTIPDCEQQGIQPPWRTLDPCTGMGPIVRLKVFRIG